MKTVIHFFGLKRSGNHPIINWLFEGIDKQKFKCLHYNDILGAHEEIPEDISISNLLPENGESNFFEILSYEDEDISLYKNFQTRIKNSKRTDIQETAILLLRDPFNLFASRLKRLRNLEKIDYPVQITKVPWQEVISLWKIYAREYLGETNYLDNKININYNLWFSDRKYREKIMAEMGLLNINESTLDKVSKYGRGSSFDFLKYDGKGREMKVLERWKYYKDDPFFKTLFEDEEILNLSKRIFGEIEGAEIFYP